MTIEPKLIYKKYEIEPDREIWDNGDSITKIIKYTSQDQQEHFDLDTYNRFRKNNPTFVKIKKYNAYDDRCVIVMDKIKGTSASKYLKTESKDKIWNICIINYFKWMKAFLDFSKNNKQIYFHTDLNPANVIIDENSIPHVVDPDGIRWGEKTLFITRMQRLYFQYLEYIVYKI